MKKSYYAVIPASIRYDEDLSPNAKLLYGELTALSEERGYCWATNQYFADLYKVHKNTVSAWVSALADKGYIELRFIDKEDGSQERQISIVVDPLRKNLKGGTAFPEDPLRENLKQNTTIDNDDVVRGEDDLKLNKEQLRSLYTKPYTKVNRAEFKALVLAFEGYTFDGGLKLSKGLLMAFWDHWSEPNASGYMRFQLERTWDLKRRLKNWAEKQREIDARDKAKVKPIGGAATDGIHHLKKVGYK